jgi:nucleotide-binding universal stress UspA family protein
VLGVADDESSDTATRFAAREAVAVGTSLDAVHAWRLPQPSMDAVSSIIVGPEELEAIHQELLQRVTDRLGDAAPGVVVRGVLRHGDPAVEIDEVLDDTRLLVMGTHGHGPTLGALLGSKVQHLLHHGGVPVAVVPLEARIDA